jgi:hypothetical protein
MMVMVPARSNAVLYINTVLGFLVLETQVNLLELLF